MMIFTSSTALEVPCLLSDRDLEFSFVDYFNHFHFNSKNSLNFISKKELFCCCRACRLSSLRFQRLSLLLFPFADLDEEESVHEISTSEMMRGDSIPKSVVAIDIIHLDFFFLRISISGHDSRRARKVVTSIVRSFLH